MGLDTPGRVAGGLARMIALTGGIEAGRTVMNTVKLCGLAESLGVSRTTVRKVLSHVARTGVITVNGRTKTLARRPLKSDYRDLGDDGQARSELAERVENLKEGGALIIDIVSGESYWLEPEKRVTAAFDDGIYKVLTN